jgi:hypothetical protein
MIWSSINDPRSPGSWCIKGTDKTLAQSGFIGFFDAP